MRTNIPPKLTERTHEGAPVRSAPHSQILRRAVSSCLLWENTFYEDGVTIASRIANLVPLVDAQFVADLAVDARTRLKLRHAPLWLLVSMLDGGPEHRKLVRGVTSQIIQRPDEIMELLSLLWMKSGKRPKMPNAIKRGISDALSKFDEYQLAKWRSDGKSVTLNSCIRLCHPKPKGEERAALMKRALLGELKTPDTWEVALSSGADKKETWTRLLTERKLGALALLRNLRNMTQVGVDLNVIGAALQSMKTDRVLPYRFIAAARAVPQIESLVEVPMLAMLESAKKLPGRTALIVDNSGSMADKLSAKSDLTRIDAACALAILLREICAEAAIISFSDDAKIVAPRRGFALADAIKSAVRPNSTNTQKAVELAALSGGYDRIVIITDEQSHQRISHPLPKTRGYIMNVAQYKNGVGYGPWTTIDGWSESLVRYLQETELGSSDSEPEPFAEENA